MISKFSIKLNTRHLLFVLCATILSLVMYSCRRNSVDGPESPKSLLEEAKTWYLQQSSLPPPDDNSRKLKLRDFKPNWSKAVTIKNTEGGFVIGVPMASKGSEYFELNVTIKNRISYGVIKHYIYATNTIAELKLYNGNGQLVDEGTFNAINNTFTSRNPKSKFKSPLYKTTMETSGEGIPLENVTIVGSGGGTSGGGGGGTFGPPVPSGPINGDGSTPPVVPGETPEVLAFELEYKERMCATEKTLYNEMSRWHQICYLLNAKESIDRASSLYPGNQEDSKADAFRHAYFSARNSIHLGAAKAKELGDAHETCGGTAISRDMDLHNNAAGRTAFAAGIYDEAGIKGLVTNGTLKYIVTYGVTRYLVPTNQ